MIRICTSTRKSCWRSANSFPARKTIPKDKKTDRNFWRKIRQNSIFIEMHEYFFAEFRFDTDKSLFDDPHDCWGDPVWGDLWLEGCSFHETWPEEYLLEQWDDMEAFK
ncbi:MAG: hypothetical protein AAF623_12675 [Planctomycetota bacterium]